MIAILFPRFAPTCKMHHNRMLFPSLHFLEFRGVQPDPLIISRIPQILKIISVWEVFHRSVQHHVQSILIRKKALLRMLPDELHQPTCHIMLPPIVHIDQQYPRVKIRRTIHSNPVLQSNVISLLILHHRARIAFNVRPPKFLQRIVYQNIAIHIKHLLLVRKQIRQKETVVYGLSEPIAHFQALQNLRMNSLDRQTSAIPWRQSVPNPLHLLAATISLSRKYDKAAHGGAQKSKPHKGHRPSYNKYPI